MIQIIGHKRIKGRKDVITSYQVSENGIPFSDVELLGNHDADDCLAFELLKREAQKPQWYLVVAPKSRDKMVKELTDAQRAKLEAQGFYVERLIDWVHGHKKDPFDDYTTVPINGNRIT